MTPDLIHGATMSDTPKRPTDAELVKLLREAAESVDVLVRLSRGVDTPHSEIAREAVELRAAADALAAASADTFGAKPGHDDAFMLRRIADRIAAAGVTEDR